MDEPLDLDAINPARNFTLGENIIAEIFSKLLPYLLTFAGLLLLIMIISSGFTMLTNPTNPQAQEQGRARLTQAFLGFLLLFLSYWLIQALEIIFGLSIV